MGKRYIIYGSLGDILYVPIPARGVMPRATVIGYLHRITEAWARHDYQQKHSDGKLISNQLMLQQQILILQSLHQSCQQ
jgi:hypothetical protein